MNSMIKKSLILFILILPLFTFTNVIARGEGGGGRGGGGFEGGGVDQGGSRSSFDQGDHRAYNPEAVKDEAASRRDWNQGFDAADADNDVYLAPPNEGAPPEVPINPYPYPQ
jgi:hypothetical protein